MNLDDWLRQERGRAQAMADHFGVNKTAVFGWRTIGVPPSRMKAIRDYTLGAVTLEEMVPEPVAPQAVEGQ